MSGNTRERKKCGICNLPYHQHPTPQNLQICLTCSAIFQLDIKPEVKRSLELLRTITVEGNGFVEIDGDDFIIEGNSGLGYRISIENPFKMNIQCYRTKYAALNPGNEICMHPCVDLAREEAEEIPVGDLVFTYAMALTNDVQAAEEIETNGPDQFLKGLHGVVIPGGFGDRGIEGMISAVEFARQNKLPYLGLCLGMQVMVIEAARNLLGKKSANSQEFDLHTPDPVIHLMEDQVDITQKGGTMRLGVYPCEIQPNSLTAKAYSEKMVMERHRHRYEVNNDYREELSRIGLKATGLSPDGRLVEIMEIEDHPFMAGTQFHPEFLSRPVRPHPMFRDFIAKSYEAS